MTLNWIDKEFPQSMEVKYGYEDTVKGISFRIFQDICAEMQVHPHTILKLDINIHRLLRWYRIFSY
jgi:hypothetical protein